MKQLLRVALVLSVVVAAPVLACEHGHDHSAVSVNIGPLQLVGVRVHTPCHDVVVPIPVFASAAPVASIPEPPMVVVEPTVIYQPPPVYVSPPVQRVAYYSPPPMVAGPPVVVTSPPIVIPVAPLPVASPQPVIVAAPPAPEPAPQRPAIVALKYTPGASAGVNWGSSTEAGGLSDVAFSQTFGLEFRVARWLAIRGDVEFRKGGRSYDPFGLKVWVAPWSVLKPYLSASLSASDTNANPGRLAVGIVGATGLDLMLGRHFFFEAEVRYRLIPGTCCRDVPQLTGVLGAGVAFF